MKNKTLPILSVLVVLVLLIGSGCGKKYPGVAEEEPMDVLRQASEAMAQARTYRLKGTVSAKADGLMGAGSGVVEMALEFENRDGDIRQHILLSVGGVSMEAYMVEGVFYQQVPGQGWVKMNVAEYRAQNMDLGMIGPEQLGILTDSALDLKIVGVDRDAVGLSFRLGKEYLLASIGLYRRNIQDGEEWGLEGLDMLEKAAEDFSASVKMWIRKADMLIRSMEMSYAFGDLGGMGSVETAIKAEYYDYNADIRVELPEEARQAEEFDSSDT